LPARGGQGVERGGRDNKKQHLCVPLPSLLFVVNSEGKPANSTLQIVVESDQAIEVCAFLYVFGLISVCGHDVPFPVACTSLSHLCVWCCLSVYLSLHVCWLSSVPYVRTHLCIQTLSLYLQLPPPSSVLPLHRWMSLKQCICFEDIEHGNHVPSTNRSRCEKAHTGRHRERRSTYQRMQQGALDTA